jgi:hypothetical protein
MNPQMYVNALLCYPFLAGTDLDHQHEHRNNPVHDAGGEEGAI